MLDWWRYLFPPKHGLTLLFKSLELLSILALYECCVKLQHRSACTHAPFTAAVLQGKEPAIMSHGSPVTDNSPFGEHVDR